MNWLNETLELIRALPVGEAQRQRLEYLTAEIYRRTEADPPTYRCPACRDTLWAVTISPDGIATGTPCASLACANERARRCAERVQTAPTRSKIKAVTRQARDLVQEPPSGQL